MKANTEKGLRLEEAGIKEIFLAVSSGVNNVIVVISKYSFSTSQPILLVRRLPPFPGNQLSKNCNTFPS